MPSAQHRRTRHLPYVHLIVPRPRDRRACRLEPGTTVFRIARPDRMGPQNQTASASQALRQSLRASWQRGCRARGEARRSRRHRACLHHGKPCETSMIAPSRANQYLNRIVDRTERRSCYAFAHALEQQTDPVVVNREVAYRQTLDLAWQLGAVDTDDAIDGVDADAEAGLQQHEQSARR